VKERVGETKEGADEIDLEEEEEEVEDKDGDEEEEEEEIEDGDGDEEEEEVDEKGPNRAELGRKSEESESESPVFLALFRRDGEERRLKSSGIESVVEGDSEEPKIGAVFGLASLADEEEDGELVVVSLRFGRAKLAQVRRRVPRSSDFNGGAEEGSC
jgi:hypothetical protein